jgi:hypothetical protein
MFVQNYSIVNGVVASKSNKANTSMYHIGFFEQCQIKW